MRLVNSGFRLQPTKNSTLLGAPNGTVVKAVHIRQLRTRATSGAGNSSSGGSSGGLKYVLSDIQGSTRAVMSNNGNSSTVLARHDYLPFGEEIGSSIGGRTSGQGYSAADLNRWKTLFSNGRHETLIDRSRRHIISCHEGL